MKSRRIRRAKSKFKFPLALTLTIIAIAAFSFGLGAYISHASVTLNGSGVTASSTSSNFLELTSSTNTLFSVDNLGNVGANEFFGSTVSTTPYPNLSFTSTGGLDLNAGGTNQDINLNPTGTGATVATNLEDKGGQVYNFLAYGGVANERIDSGNCSITAGSAVVTCSDAPFSSSDVGKSAVFNSAGASSADLTTVIDSYQSPSQVTLTASASVAVSSGGTFTWGTDNTAALNSLLQTVYDAGGGEIFIPAGKYLILGQVVVPNSGGSALQNASMEIKGAGGTAQLIQPATQPPPAATQLDLRYTVATDNGSTGKIQMLGYGYFAMTDLGLIDHGTDCLRFVFDSNTTLKVYRNSIIGTHEGTAACQEGFKLGTGAPVFQGYGTDISDNFFGNIRGAVFLGPDANAVVVRDNLISNTCGSTLAGVGAISMSGATTNGNYIAGNLVEDTNYSVPAFYDNGLDNTYVGNQTWDASPTSRAYYFTSGANILLASRDDEVVKYGLQNLFASGSAIPIGFSPANYSQPSITGTTAGNLYPSEPTASASGKTVILNFQSYENNSSTAQTWTFPISFGYTPSVIGCTLPTGVTVSASGMSAVSMAAPFTGQCIVEGQ